MSVAKFSVNNPVAINLLMWSMIVSGIYCWFDLRREFFPNSEPEQIYIKVLYPGATPDEIEDAVTKRIEREIKDISGIKKIESQIFEGVTILALTMESNTDKQELINDLRGEIDKVKPDLPQETEDPEILEIRPFVPVMIMVLFGDVSEEILREEALQIRDELSDYPQISEIFISGIRDREIWIEVLPQKLEEYKLTFAQVGQALSQNNLDLPGGELKGLQNNIRVRTIGKNKKAIKLEELFIRNDEKGNAIFLRDIARVRETFEDKVEAGRYQGKRACSITILKSPEEDALEIAELVKEYKEKNPTRLGGAIEVDIIRNLSRFISGRLDLMLRNARIGLFFVIITLAIFLDFRVTFWVTAGLPTAFLATFLLMKIIGVSINLMSLFGLIIVLGLIVDDAIIVGENVFSKMRTDLSPNEAAIQGTQEVTMPVVAAVLTTIVAFVPLALIEGNIGRILGQIPLVVIAALLMSLVEVLFILPSHLGHSSSRSKPTSRVGKWMSHIDEKKYYFFENTLPHLFEKLLRFLISWRYATMAVLLGVSLGVFSLVVSGIVPFVFVQDVDAETIQVNVEMAAGTPQERTTEVIDKIEKAAFTFPEVKNIFSVVGTAFSEKGQETLSDPATVAQLTIELIPAEKREKDKLRSAQQFIAQMREKIGLVVGGKKLEFLAISGGPPGADIEILIKGENFEQVREVLTYVRGELSLYDGIIELDDNLTLGKQEVQIALLPSARFLGISTSELALQIRHALFGFEIQRFQEDVDEIVVRVLLDKGATQKISDLARLKIATPSGARVPLEEVAHLRLSRGYSSLHRFNSKRAVTLKARVNEEIANVSQITDDLSKKLGRIEKKFPEVKISFEGEKKRVRESLDSLAVGFPAALLIIYAIITIVFKSYFQPFLIMVVIPFSIVGAIAGHFIMGYPLTFVSMVGCVALAGIVVNDSLILVDFINRLRRERELDISKATIEGAKKRLRAILLTTITTVAGLAPLMLERSFQAQFLVPMAISLVFGLIFATVLTLIIIPVLYMISEDIKAALRWLWIGK